MEMGRSQNLFTENQIPPGRILTYGSCTQYTQDFSTSTTHIDQYFCSHVTSVIMRTYLGLLPFQVTWHKQSSCAAFSPGEL